jgi:hypothetical protein
MGVEGPLGPSLSSNNGFHLTSALAFTCYESRVD